MHSPQSFRCNVCTMYPFFSSLSCFLMYIVHHLFLFVYTDIVYYYAKAQSHSFSTYQSYQSSSVSIACGKSSMSSDVVCIQIHLIYVGPHLNAHAVILYSMLFLASHLFLVCIINLLIGVVTNRYSSLLLLNVTDV